MKRVISLVLAVVLLLSVTAVPVAAEGSTPSLSLSVVPVTIGSDGTITENSESEFKAGDYIMLKVALNNDATVRYVQAVQLAVTYDSEALTTVQKSTSAGKIGPGVNLTKTAFTKATTTPEAGVATLSLMTDGWLEVAANGSVELAGFLFQVNDAVETGTYHFGFDTISRVNKIEALLDTEAVKAEPIELDFANTTFDVAITGNPPALGSVVITPTEGDAEAAYGEVKTYTLKALSDKGKDITNCVTWSVAPNGDHEISDYTIEGNTLTVTNAQVGTYTVTATPKENLCTGSAEGTFTVTPQRILNLRLELTGYGKGLDIADAKITGNDGVTVGPSTWYEGESEEAAYGTFKAATAYKVAVTLTPDDNHEFAAGAQATLAGKNASIADNTAVFILDPTEDKDTPTVVAPKDLSATYGQKLSEVSVAGFKATFGSDETEVAGKFHWEDGTQFVGNVGSQEHTIVFTPNDTENYATTSAQVSVRVTPADIGGAVIENIADQEYTGQEIKPEPEVKLGGVMLTKDVDYELTYSGNTAITENAKVTVTGKGNYTGSCEKTFRIVKSLSSEDVTIEVPDEAFVYSGSKFEPEVTVKDDGKLLVEGTDYVVSYSNNTNAGTAAVKVKGIGSYTGEKTVNFTISQKELTVTVGTITKVYDGKTNATLNATLNGRLDDDDVDVVPPSAAEFASPYVGTHNITFTGSFELNGDAAGNYTLTQPTGITGTITAATRTLTSLAPSESPAKLTKGGKTLDLSTLVSTNTPEKTGITFDCQNLQGCELKDGILTSGETSGQTLAITVKGAAVDLNGDGKPEYDAATDITIYVQIVDKLDAGLTVNGLTEGMSMTYGDEKTLTWSVKSGVSGGEITFASDTESVIRAEGSKISAVGVGTATITVTYDSADYYGQKTFTVTVGKKSITVTADDQPMVYGDELPKELNYTVTEGALVGGDKLTIVAETNATSKSSVGDYTITLTAAENANPNYAVTMLPGTLTITPAPLTIKSATVQGKTYDGTKNAVVTEVEFNGLKNDETLAESDYTAAGEFKDANAGAEKEVSVTVTLSATDTAANYELKSNTFTAKAAIAKRVTELTLSAENAVYTGEPYAQSNITVGSTAATFKFFTNVGDAAAAEISRPTDVGTYWVKATVEESQNEAKSEKSVKFTITPKELSADMVEAIPDQTYTGEQITPAVTIKYNGMTLTAGTDYEVSYGENVTVGANAGAVTINGQGNYFGTIIKSFTITAKPVTGAEVTFSDETLTYNGAAQHPEKITVKVGNVTLEAGKDYTASYPASANAGEHTATVTFTGNYSGSATAKYTIEKRTAALSWSPADESLLYTGSACEVTASVSNKVETDEVNVTVVGGRQTAIGSYTATATALDNSNYQLPATDLTHSFKIKNAIESISAATGSGQSKTVTATVDGLTIKLTGTMKEGDSLALTINGANYTVTDANVVNVRVGEKQITYTLDKTGLTETPANVDLKETAPAVETTSTDEATVKAAQEISQSGAQSEGLAAAAAEAVTNEAASKAAGEETITAETKLEIQVVSYEKNTADNKSVLTLEITPKVTYKDASDVVIETKDIPNSAIKAPVTISIKLPDGMPTDDLFVKHELENGGVEYLKVTVDENRVATWQQSSFSPVVLMADNRTATIKLVKDDKSEIDMKLDLSSVGTVLPKDGSKSKWTFEGISGSYDTITKELFDELAKKTGTVIKAVSASGSSSDPDSKPTTPGSSSASLLVPGLGDDDLIFRDVSKYDYYYNAVKWAVKKGVTSGTGRYTFSPDAACTRAQTVTFLWRAAGCPKADTKANPFTDVAASDYFYEAVLWAVENGITNGTSKTTFSPNASVTRAQVAAFLWRANGEPAASDSGFTDVASNAYYAKAVAWAYAEGITTGTGFGVFSPEAVCTRAQIVTFLFRNAK